MRKLDLDLESFFLNQGKGICCIELILIDLESSDAETCDLVFF